jgi:hypothetical protein
MVKGVMVTRTEALRTKIGGGVTCRRLRVRVSGRGGSGRRVGNSGGRFKQYWGLDGDERAGLVPLGFGEDFVAVDEQAADGID